MTLYYDILHTESEFTHKLLCCDCYEHIINIGHALTSDPNPV